MDSANVSELVDAFFSNDPYYPRPVLQDALYIVFKQAYMGACLAEHRAGAAAFLQAIEARQAANPAIV